MIEPDFREVFKASDSSQFLSEPIPIHPLSAQASPANPSSLQALPAATKSERTFSTSLEITPPASQISRVSAAEERVLLDLLIEEFLRRTEQGEEPIIEEFISRFPQAEAELRELWPVLPYLSICDVNSDSTATRSIPNVEEGEEPWPELEGFEVIREIARGPMGIVYEASEASLQRRVALKVLPQRAARDERKLRRFQNEARAAAGLSHSQIVPVYGLAEQNGMHYFIMEFVDGLTVAQLIAQTKLLGNGDWKGEVHCLSEAFCGGPRKKRAYQIAVVGMISEVAAAIAYAHGQGVLHRDIKPSNILIDPHRGARLFDFGLCSYLADEAKEREIEVVGTLRYMPPERFKGQALPEGDVYALGLTLFELLTLEPAFDASTKALLLEQVSKGGLPLEQLMAHDIPQELLAILARACDSSPSRRYASAAKLLSELQRFLEGCS